MHFTKALILAFFAFTGALALPCDECTKHLLEVSEHLVHSNITARAVQESGSETGDDWRIRPWGVMTAKFFSYNMKDINADHDAVVTPSLPIGLKIPSPLLPTDNSTIKDLYHLAVDTFEVNEKKTLNEKAAELTQKRRDIDKFNEMDMCWHVIRLCNGVKQKLKRTFGRATYKKEYRSLMKKLVDEMKVAGLVNLGKDLKEYMAKSGEEI